MLLIINDDGLWNVWETVLRFHLVGYMALAILQPFRKIWVLMDPCRIERWFVSGVVDYHVAVLRVVF